jgi:hypothetical protein
MSCEAGDDWAGEMRRVWCWGRARLNISQRTLRTATEFTEEFVGRAEALGSGFLIGFMFFFMALDHDSSLLGGHVGSRRTKMVRGLEPCTDGQV